MNKQEFVRQLREKLSEFPKNDIAEHLTFYSEMIDDRIEEGLSEEDAVSAVGSAEEIAAEIIADRPYSKASKEKANPKHHFKAWEIVLLVLGSPIWLSLIVAAAAVILSIYVSLWSLIISLWAVFGSLAGCFIGCVLAGIVVSCTGKILTGIALISAGLVCAGLSIFMFYGCKAATNGILMLTKKFTLWIKKCFAGNEGIQ